jgi:hypothetical protein
VEEEESDEAVDDWDNVDMDEIVDKMKDKKDNYTIAQDKEEDDKVVIIQDSHQKKAGANTKGNKHGAKEDDKTGVDIFNVGNDELSKAERMK